MEAQLVERLEKAVAKLEAISSSSSSLSSSRNLSISDGDPSSDQSIKAFDDLIADNVARVSSAAEKIGGKVLETTNVLRDSFSVLRDLLVQVKQTQKPDAAGMGEFLKPLNELIMKANALTEGKPTDFFNHQKTVSGGLSSLAWIAYTGKGCGMNLPIAHVEESWQMAEFYSNKVLVEYKNKDPNHVEWVKAIKELFVPGLRDYVKSYYALGPVWSSTGKVVSAPPKTSGPAAPAPPPSGSLASSKSSSSKPKGDMCAIFQEINSGSLTSGLKKVTNDMKTKNRADRGGVVSATEKGSHARAPAQPKTGPPKFELQMGRKWVVENQIGQKSLVIEDCDAKQSVYIFGCKDSVLQIKDKINNITLDKCTKMGVLFKDVVAACEIVNCNSVEVQCQGSAPTVSVDNTSGCQIYLSKEALKTSITTAKSSEINVMIPASEADGDWGEIALPQQYIHIYKDGQFETTPMSHSGG